MFVNCKTVSRTIGKGIESRWGMTHGGEGKQEWRLAIDWLDFHLVLCINCIVICYIIHMSQKPQQTWHFHIKFIWQTQWRRTKRTDKNDLCQYVFCKFRNVFTFLLWTQHKCMCMIKTTLCAALLHRIQSRRFTI